MRHVGNATFLECHIVMPGDMPLHDAHAFSDRIEAALREDEEHMVVTIHMEPEKAQHHCMLVL